MPETPTGATPEISGAGDPTSKAPETPKEPVKSTPIEKGKKREIALVNVDEENAQQIRAAAEERLTRSRNELKGISGFFKKIWTHNWFREYNRQREMSRGKDVNKQTGNIYAARGLDQAVMDRTTAAVTARFLREHADAIHKGKDAKNSEVKETLTGKTETERRVQAELRQIIEDYASGKIDDASLREREKRVYNDNVAALGNDGLKPAEILMSNLLVIAKDIKVQVEEGAKLNELDLDLDVTFGRAKLGARTEVEMKGVDRAVEWVKQTRVGQFVNETTVAAGVGLAYSVGEFFSQKLVNNKVAAWFTFGGTAAVGGLIAGAREHELLKAERRQHAREMAESQTFDPNRKEAPRRAEMQEYTYATESAVALAESLETAVANNDPAAIAAALAKTEARIQLSDQERVDLLRYSSAETLEEERLRLDDARAAAKLTLRNLGEDFTTLVVPELERLRNEANVEITAKDRAFTKFKRSQALKKGLIGFGTSLVIGATVQQLVALGRDAYDAVFGGTGRTSQTAVEGLLAWMQGSKAETAPVDPHEVIIGKNHLRLPEGVDFAPSGNGYALKVDGEVLLDGLGTNKDGFLDQQSVDALREAGIETSMKRYTQEIRGFKAITRTAHEYLLAHQDAMKDVNRLLWYDNDTQMYRGADGKLYGADHNELRLWWGNEGNNGITKNGSFVMNVSAMTPEGSWHTPESTNAQELIAGGKMRLLLSVSENTQGHVFDIPIDKNGNAIIPPDHPAAKLFTVKDGHAVFLGRFAEAAQVIGDHNGELGVKLLATHEGEGIRALRDRVPTLDYGFTRHTTLTFPETENKLPTPPPVIPIVGRSPLEPVKYKKKPIEGTSFEPSYFETSGGSAESEEQQRQRMSETIRNNPDATLDQYKEIATYFERQDPAHRAEVKALAVEAGKMRPDCRLSICIPAAGHQEGKVIYKTLSNFLNQTAQKDEFEIVVFVNSPATDKAGNPVKPDATYTEVQRFQRDHPELHVRLMHAVLPFDEALIGNARKLLNDATLLRSQERGPKAPELILVSTDADNEGVAPEYVANFIEKFDQHRNVDAMMGQLDWDPKSYVRNPLLHVGFRMLQYAGALDRKHGAHWSSGANFAFRASTYAAIDGYSANRNGGEDTDLGSRITLARKGAKNRIAKAYAGTRVSRLYTSSRRAEKVWRMNGLVPAEQWQAGDFRSNSDEVRNIDWSKYQNEINFDNPDEVSNFVKDLSVVINQSIPPIFGRNADATSPSVRRVLGLLGIQFRPSPNGSGIEITDASKLITGLKQYKTEGIPLYERKIGLRRAPEQTVAIDQEAGGRLRWLEDQVRRLQREILQRNPEKTFNEANFRTDITDLGRRYFELQAQGGVVDQYRDQLANAREQLRRLEDLPLEARTSQGPGIDMWRDYVSRYEQAIRDHESWMRNQAAKLNRSREALWELRQQQPDQADRMIAETTRGRSPEDQAAFRAFIAEGRLPATT